MEPTKDPKTGKWLIQYRYTDWQGNRKKSCKRGFNTKREANEWVAEFLRAQNSSLNMTFASFYDIYINDLKIRVKENTLLTKESIFELKILPYFKNFKLNEIKPKDIVAWQNEMLNSKDKYGKPYSETYLRKINSQLSALFNHAVRYYGLEKNPVQAVDPIGQKKPKNEMQIWTQEQYEAFSNAIMDKPESYQFFQLLWYTGMRLGEALALTKSDFDLENKTVRISKSYQRIKGRDVITPPKTPASNRTIQISSFLCEQMKFYFSTIYGLKDNQRIFTISKSFVHHELDRGCKIAGVPRIRVHDIRHSHVSALIDLGFTPVAISRRVGHDSIEITYRTYAHEFKAKEREIADRLELIGNKDGF